MGGLACCHCGWADWKYSGGDGCTCEPAVSIHEQKPGIVVYISPCCLQKMRHASARCLQGFVSMTRCEHALRLQEKTGSNVCAHPRRHAGLVVWGTAPVVTAWLGLQVHWAPVPSNAWGRRHHLARQEDVSIACAERRAEALRSVCQYIQ